MARRANKKFIIRMSVIAAVLFVVAAVGGWWKFVYSKNPLPYVKAGDEAMQQARYEDAVEAYAKAIRLKDIDLNVWIKLGDAQNHLAGDDIANLYKARNIWEASLGQNPSFLPAHKKLLEQAIEIADVAGGANRVQWLDKAAANAKNILRIEPDNKEAKFAALQVVIEGWLAGQQVSDPLKITETIDGLRAIQAEQPDDPRVPFTIARALIQQGGEALKRGEKQEATRLWDESFAIMKAAAEAHPQDGRFWIRYAQLMGGVGPRQDKLLERDEAKNRQLAKETYDAAAELALKGAPLLKVDSPTYQQDVLTAATIAQRAGKAKESETILRSAVEAKPDEIGLRLALVELLRSDSRKLAEAVELLSKVPPSTKTRAGVEARGYVETRDRANLMLAELKLDQYIAQRDTSTPESNAKLMSEATELLAKGDPKDLETARVLRIKGKMQLFSGDAVEAVRTLRRALEAATDPNDRVRYEVMYLLARAYMITEQTGEAEQLFREITERMDYYPARVELVRLLLRKGSLAEAEKLLSELEQSNPDSVDMIGLRMAYEELANKSRSPEDVKRNLAKLPEDTLPRQVYKTRIAFAAKQYAESIRLAELVLKQRPDDRTVTMLVAQSYDALGERAKAVAYLDDFIKRYPDNPAIKLAAERLRGASPEQLRAMGLKEIEAIPDPLQRNLLLYEFAMQSGDQKRAEAAVAEVTKLAPEDPRVVEARFQYAVRSRDDATAEKLLEIITRLNIDSAEGRSARAKYLLELASRETDLRKREEKVQKAIDAAVELTQSRGEFDSVWAVLGQAYQMAGRTDEAIAAYTQAINRKPQNRDALEGLVRCYYQKRRKDDVRRYIDQALSMYPKNRVFIEFLVSWHIEFGNPKDAIAQREADLKEMPDSVMAYGNLAAAYNTAADKTPDDAERAKLRQKSFDYFSQGIEKFPNSVELVAYYAEVAQELGKFELGEKAWLKLAADEKYAKSPVIAERVAGYYRRAGKFEKAIEYCNNFLKDNTSPAMRVFMADTYISMKKPEEADKQLTLAGDDPMALRRRTDLLLAAGKGDEAEALVQKAAETRPNDTTILNRLAFVYISRGKFDLADQMLKRVLEINPQDPQAIFFLAMLDAQAGKFEDAMQRVNRLRDLEPDNADVRKLASQLYRQQNNIANATTELEFVLRLDPEDKSARMQLVDLYLAAQPPRLTDADRLIRDAKKLPSVSNDPLFGHSVARYYYARGDYAKALEELKPVLKERPSDLAIQDTYFRTMMAAKQYDAVVKTATSLLEQVKQPWIYSTRGSAYARLKQVDKAMGDFEAGYQLAGENTDDMSQQNIIRAMFGEVGADAAVSFLVPRSKGNDLIKIFLAQIHTLTTKYDKAHELVVDVFPRRDQLPEKQRLNFLKLAGAVSLSLEPPDIALSRQAYDEYLVKQPTDYQVINNVAYLLMLPGSGAKPGEAVDYAKRAVSEMTKLSRKEPLVLDTLGTALLESGKVDEAIIVLRDALLIEEFPDGLVHLADGLVRKQEFTDASTALDKAQLIMEKAKSENRVPPGGFTKLEQQMNELRLKIVGAQGAPSQPPNPPPGSTGGN